jgi:hypothetical protein
VLGRNSPARQALHDAEARLAELQAEALRPTGAMAAACHPVAGPVSFDAAWMTLHMASTPLAHMPAAIVAGKALVTFALPSGAMMCVAAAEPSLGRRAANVLLCRRAASSQLLKGEPVLVSRSVPCTCVTSRSMHPTARQSLHPAVCTCRVSGLSNPEQHGLSFNVLQGA